mgnify:CR=1 FL=1
MSLALVLAKIRDQVAAVTPERLGSSPFVPHTAAGSTMDLRTQATANPLGMHRHYEVRFASPVDDGAATATARRWRATVTIIVAYEWGLMCQQDDAELTLGADSQSIIDRLWNPNNWDEPTTGLMSCTAGAPKATRLRDADVVMLEVPFTIIYY